MKAKPLSLLTLCGLLTSALTQQQSTSPTKTTGTAPAGTSVVLADTDDACHLFLDDTDEGIITPSQSRKLKAAPGEHIIKCSVEGVPDLLSRKVIEVKAGAQSAVVISLKALHIQHDEVVEEQKQQQEQTAAAEEKEKVQAKAAKEEQKVKEAREQEEFPQRLFEQVKGEWTSEVSCQHPTWDDHETRHVYFQSLEGATVWVRYDQHVGSPILIYELGNPQVHVCAPAAVLREGFLSWEARRQRRAAIRR